MSKIKIIDTNQELIQLLQSNFPAPSYHNVEIIHGDVLDHITESTVICTAPNPDFNPAGGLDAALAKKFPNTWAKAREGRVDNLFFAVTVSEKLKASYSLVFKAIRDAHQGVKSEETLILTGMGTGAGGLDNRQYLAALRHGLRSFNEARVSSNAWVSCNARVFDNAVVHGGAQISGNAKVHGNAKVFGNAVVFDNARVYGNARVFGNARIFGNAKVHGNARAGEDQIIIGHLSVDITEGKNMEQSIYAQTLHYPISQEIILFKKVKKTEAGRYFSLHDNSFEYKVNETATVDDPDTDPASSCASGLHFSYLHYWDGGNAALAAKIKIGDIIAVQEGKIRCRKAKIIGEVNF